MANALDDAFDALPEAPAPVSSLDAEFDALPEAERAPTEEVAPSVTGFTAEDIDPAQADQKAARHQRLRLAFDAAQQTGDKAARAYAVKNALGVKYSEALDNLEGFESAAKLAQFDPERYERDNPVLAKLLERRPELAELVLTDKEAPITARAWAQALRWMAPLRAWAARPEADTSSTDDKALRAQGRENWEDAQAQRQGLGLPTAPSVASPAERTPEELAAAQLLFDETSAQRLAKETAALERPTQVQELDDAKAKLGKEYGGAFVAFLRAKEAAAQEAVGQAQLDWMQAEVKHGEDSPEAFAARGRLDDLQLEVIPRAYGDDSGLSRQLAIGIETGASSVRTLKGYAEGYTAGALLGGTIAGAGAFVLTRSPAAAARAFGAGAGVLSPAGGKLRAGWTMFNMELGPTYEGNRQLVTDDGHKLTAREAFGAAVLESGVATGLESLSFGVQTKALAGGLSAMKDRLRGQLLTNPAFRERLARFGAEWLKGAAAEGGTEGLQSLAKQLGDYLVQSGKDTKAADLLPGGDGLAWQKVPVVDGREILIAAEAGLAGGALFGGATGLVGLGMAQTAGDRQQHLNRQVPSLLAMARAETFKTAPDAFAEVVQEATGETSLHVDGGVVVRYLQENVPNPGEADQLLNELVGPGASAKLLEAASTRGKLEIPMDRVPAWASSDIGKALTASTTMDPESLSLEQQKERAAEIEAEAMATVEAETAKLEEAQHLVDQATVLEQQLVDAGMTKEKARALAALPRAVQATAAAEFGLGAKELFAEPLVTVARGDEKASGREGRLNQEKDWADRILEAATKLEQQPEGRTRAGFFDTLTGLFNRRGFDALPQAKPGGVLVALTSTDSKPINDKINHVQTDRLFKALAGHIATLDPHAGRDGTTFFFRADSQGDARAAVTALQARLPEGLSLSLGFGEDSTGAMADLEDQVDTGRAKGRAAEGLPATPADPELLAEFPGAPVLPAERLGTRLDLKALKERPELLEAGDAARAPGAIPGEVAAAAAKAFASTGDFAKDQFLDQATGGVIFNGRGWEAMGDKAYVAAFDGIGLKALNEQFTKIAREQLGMSRRDAKAWGRKQGDGLLRAIAEAAHRMGGAGVAFSRLSGDEYAAKSDDLEVLKQFTADLMAHLAELRFDVVLPDGSKVEMPVGIRWGIGEKTYERADTNLAERKAGAGSDADLPGSEDPGERTRRAAGRGTLDPTRLDRQGMGGANEEGADQEVTRLNQDDGAIPKGYTELPSGRALQRAIAVFLNKGADETTVIHEFGHAFLEQRLDLAERPDAPQRTKDFAEAVFKALGVTKRSEITRAHHEKFARAFEQYTKDGKAPSSALRKVFAKFTRWVTAVYRTLAGIPGAELAAELRPVFDAMLATQAQLEAMRRAQGPKPTAEQLGVTEQERAEQLEQEADEYTEGSHAAQLAAVKDALRVREAWWKKGLQKLETLFGDEYEQLPARRTQQLLVENELVLDRAAVQEVIGDAKFPGLRTADQGGVRPSVVAELAGYASPRAMLAELAGLRSKETWVRAQAEAEMRRLHPSILEDVAKFRGMLSDGLRSATEKRLEREWKGLPREALKRAAVLLAERRQVSKLQPRRALALQRQAAHAKARAAAKGDIAAAGEAARAEMLNHFLHHELRQAETEVGKVVDLAKSLGKTSARERLGKASPTYRNAVDFIRGALGFGDPTQFDAGVLETAVGQLEGDAVTIGDPDWLAPLRAALGKTDDYTKLTVAELGAVRDALKMLETGARNRTTVLLDGKRVEKEAVLTALAQEASENKVQAPSVNSTDPVDVARRFGSMLTAPLLKIETMTDWLGGSLVGKNPRESMWHRAVYRPLEGARQREADLQRRVATPILNAWRSMPASVRDAQNDLLDSSLFPDHGVPGARQKIEAPSHRYELLMMGLHAGNESNLDRLLRGRNISRAQLQNALNLLTKEEIEWINAVGQAFEAVWPEIQAMEERLTGLKPTGIAKQPLALRNGTITGHYFPAIYDARIAGAGPVQSDQQIADLFHPTIGRPATTHGHTKARVEGHVGVIALEPSVIPVHLAQHMHDLAFREPVGSVGGLLLDKGTQDALYAALGPDRGAQFKAWLRDAARVQGIEGAETAGWTIKLMQKAKANLTVSAIGYSVPNFFEDLSGIVAALFDRELSQRHWAAGLLSFYRNPLSAWRDIEARSKGVASSVGESLMRDLTNELKTLKMSPNVALRLGQKGISKIWDHAFGLIEASFKLTAGPIWMGRYQQELDAGGSELTAVEAADAIVRRLFASHSPVNTAGIIRNKFIGGFIQFYGFFNAAANKNLDEWQRVLEAPRATMKLRAAGRAAGYMVAIGIVGALLKRRGPRDDQPPEEWAMWTMLNTVLAQAPFGSDAANLLEAKVQGRRGTARPTLIGALIAAGVDAFDVFDSDREDWARAKAFLRTAGLAGGLPASQPIRTLDYAVKVADGEVEPDGPLDLAAGLLFGAPRN